MAYVISDDCIACGTCIDECPVGAIQKVINTASTLKCVQIVELALTHVLQRLSTRLNNSQQRIGFSFAESS
jgi:ferredoxin